MIHENLKQQITAVFQTFKNHNKNNTVNKQRQLFQHHIVSIAAGVTGIINATTSMEFHVDDKIQPSKSIITSKVLALPR